MRPTVKSASHGSGLITIHRPEGPSRSATPELSGWNQPVWLAHPQSRCGIMRVLRLPAARPLAEAQSHGFS